MAIETLRTDDIRAAAALISKGCHLRGSMQTERPGIIEFELMVPEGRKTEFEALLAHCDRRSCTYDFEVNLTAYEGAFPQLKAAVKLFTKETEDDASQRRYERERRTATVR
jgi:hypothetical protein